MQDQLLHVIGEKIVNHEIINFSLELKRKEFLKEVCLQFKTEESFVNIVALETPYNCSADEYRCG
jgi:hypothetical protein